MEHRYRRPNWTCLTCGDPWPCLERRTAFLEKFDGEGLRLRSILGALALDAERDLQLTRDESYVRFVRWSLLPDEVIAEDAART